MGRVLESYFGKTTSGKEVFQYELCNNSGFSVSVLNYGGIITSINMPDRYGKVENVVLSFDTIEEYEEGTAYFGAIIGRTAGRIAKGRFMIDGEEYNIPKNNNGNNLHGGLKGFDKVIWSVQHTSSDKEAQIQLKYTSVHGEEGYPGKLDVVVTYIITDENELIIKYRGDTDKPTVVNLTNHSYFNFSGDIKRDILSHRVKVDSDKFLPVDEYTLPTGEIDDVNHVFDLRDGSMLIDGIRSSHPQIIKGNGYDHPWVLNKRKEWEIEVYEEASGRGMRIETDQPVVVMYSGNYLDMEGKLRGGVESRKHLGVCFETQNYPDGINHKGFNNGIITPDKPYEASTRYKFFTHTEDNQIRGNREDGL